MKTNYFVHFSVVNERTELSDKEIKNSIFKSIDCIPAFHQWVYQTNIDSDVKVLVHIGLDILWNETVPPPVTQLESLVTECCYVSQKPIMNFWETGLYSCIVLLEVTHISTQSHYSIIRNK
jgi:hypothetical protein